MLYPLSYEGGDLSENVSEIGAQVSGSSQTGSQQCCGGLADVRLCHRRQCSAWHFAGWRVGQVGGVRQACVASLPRSGVPGGRELSVGLWGQAARPTGLRAMIRVVELLTQA